MANWVVLVPAMAVGAVGTPERPGDTNGALVISSSLRDLKFPSISWEVRVAFFVVVLTGASCVACRYVKFAIIDP